MKYDQVAAYEQLVQYLARPTRQRLEAEEPPVVPLHLEVDREQIDVDDQGAYAVIPNKAIRNATALLEQVEQVREPGTRRQVTAALLWELVEMVLDGWPEAQTAAAMLPMWWDAAWVRWVLYQEGAAEDGGPPPDAPLATFSTFSEKVRLFPEGRSGLRWDVFVALCGDVRAANPVGMLQRSNAWLLEFLGQAFMEVLLRCVDPVLITEAGDPDEDPTSAFRSLFTRMLELAGRAYPRTHVDLADRWLGRFCARYPIRDFVGLERFE